MTPKKDEETKKAEPVKSSWQRAAEEGNPHPVAPEDRKGPLGPMVSQVKDRADQLKAILVANERLHEESEERIKSDPRYERDQELFVAAKTGQLGVAPPPDQRKSVEELKAEGKSLGGAEGEKAAKESAEKNKVDTSKVIK